MSSIINSTELIALNTTKHNSNNTNASTPPPKSVPSPDPHYRSQATIIIQVTLLATLGLVIVLGNLASIATFLKTQSLRRRCHYLVISLSFADLLVGGNTFMTMYFFLTGPQFNIFIVSLEFIDTFTGTTSILTLAVIATERFYAIYFPFRHRMLRFKFYMACTAFPWLSAVAVASLYLISYFGGNLNVYVVYTYAACLYALIALVVVIVCYAFIGLKIRQNNPSAQNQNRATRERKLAVTLLIVTLASLLTWLPHQCFIFVLYICKICKTPHFNIFFIMKFLQFFNSGINVFVYIVRMPEFRQAFLALFFNREQPTHQESTKNSSLSSVRQSAYANCNQEKTAKQKNQNQGILTNHVQRQADSTLPIRLNVSEDNAQSYNNSAYCKETEIKVPAKNKNGNTDLQLKQDNLENTSKNVDFSDIDNTKL